MLEAETALCAQVARGDVVVHGGCHFHDRVVLDVQLEGAVDDGWCLARRQVVARIEALFATVAAHTLYSAVRVTSSKASLVIRLVG